MKHVTFSKSVFPSVFQIAPRPVKCTLCPRRFPNVGSLARHMSSSHVMSTAMATGNDDELVCPHCPERVEFKSLLGIHGHLFREHGIGVAPYRCTICSKSFASQQKLRIHRSLIHHRGKAAFRLRSINRKIRLHPIRVTTSFQNSKMKNESGASSHVADKTTTKSHMTFKMRSGPSGKVIVICPVCEDEFNLHSELKEHMYAKHSDELKQGSAHSGSENKTDKEAHNKTKSGVENEDTDSETETQGFKDEKEDAPLTHACSICNQVFLTLADLTKHQQDHMIAEGQHSKPDVPKHVVESCDDGFGAKNNQSQVVAPLMNVAGISDTQRTQPAEAVRRKVQSQGGSVSIYQCPLCDKELGSRVGIRGHMYMVHKVGNANYKCNLCGEGFAWANRYYRHMRDVHGIRKGDCR